jgi:hypothetical protein
MMRPQYATAVLSLLIHNLAYVADLVVVKCSLAASIGKLQKVCISRHVLGLEFQC